VEFDVRERRGELALAHTTFHTAHDGNVLPGDALAHLAGERFGGVDLNVDVKHPGFEARLSTTCAAPGCSSGRCSPRR
jgi:hypothetical protein